MTVNNLLGESQRSVQSVSNDLEVVLNSLVVDVVSLLHGRHLDVAVFGNGSHPSRRAEGGGPEGGSERGGEQTHGGQGCGLIHRRLGITDE